MLDIVNAPGGAAPVVLLPRPSPADLRKRVRNCARAFRHAANLADAASTPDAAEHLVGVVDDLSAELAALRAFLRTQR